MPKYRPWSDAEISQMKDLLTRKVSLARAAIILKRPQASVQIQARKLGTPFPGVRAIRAALRDGIAAAEASAALNKSEA